MKKISVTAAIIKSPHDNLLFAQRRAEDKFLPHHWEFPGGKLEAGESLQDCLVREIEEEMALKISLVDEAPFETVIHHYEFATIELIAFRAEAATENLICRDHQNHLWLKKETAQNLNFAPADIPIYKKLLLTNWP